MTLTIEVKKELNLLGAIDLLKVLLAHYQVASPRESYAITITDVELDKSVEDQPSFVFTLKLLPAEIREDTRKQLYAILGLR